MEYLLREYCTPASEYNGEEEEEKRMFCLISGEVRDINNKFAVCILEAYMFCVITELSTLRGV